MITASEVSSSTHTGIYYFARQDRTRTAGNSIRIVRRDRLPEIRAAYKIRRRQDGLPARVVRIQIVPILARASTGVVFAGDHKP